MGFAREIDGYPRPPDELIDAWLLEAFPGRTLEEIDRMDWARYNRALDAREVRRIERRRAQYLAQEIKELTPDEWQTIREHDALVTGDW